MKTLIHAKSYPRSSSVLTICLALFFLQCPRLAYSQCAAAPIAAATCSGGNGAATSGITINSGQTYWVSGSSSFAGITLNGGTLRVCGTLNITVLTFSSGNLIVESGGTVNITSFPGSPATYDMNGNVVFINRGTINITSSFTLQNAGNAIYNDLSTSIFNISASVTVNSALIVNRGKMSFAALTYNGTAGDFCVQDQSITSIYALDNETTNSFTYSGTGSPACVNVTGSAVLNHNLSGSSLVHVCEPSTVTPTGGAITSPGGGWGSATLYTNCNSCATVLALSITGFTATSQGNWVQLSWTSDQNMTGNEIFYAEKSVDGVNFNTFTTITASAGQSSYTASDVNTTGGKLYYRVRAISPSGASAWSSIALVETGLTGQFQIYPNPVRANTAVTLVIPSSVPGAAQVSLVDMAGRILRTRTVMLVSGSNTLNWDLQGLTEGMYVVRIELAANGNLYGRIAVHGNW